MAHVVAVNVAECSISRQGSAGKILESRKLRFIGKPYYIVTSTSVRSSFNFGLLLMFVCLFIFL